MTKNEFRTYCYLAACRYALLEMHLRQEERTELESIIEETLINQKESLIVDSIRKWYKEYLEDKNENKNSY